MPFFSLLYFIQILINDAVDLKLNYQVVLQQRYIYTQSVENCNSRSTTMRKARNTLLLGAGGGRGNGWEGCSQHRLRGFSKAESSPGKKRNISSSSWALLSSQGLRAVPSCLLTVLNWGFSLLIFYSVLEIFKKKQNICYFTTNGLRSTVLNNLSSSFGKGGAELQSVPVP